MTSVPLHAAGRAPAVRDGAFESSGGTHAEAGLRFRTASMGLLHESAPYTGGAVMAPGAFLSYLWSSGCGQDPPRHT